MVSRLLEDMMGIADMTGTPQESTPGEGGPLPHPMIFCCIFYLFAVCGYVGGLKTISSVIRS